MEVFRITRAKYANKLMASGQPNRWNKENEYVIYTSQSKSLCVLELLANRNSKMRNIDYNIMQISIPFGEKEIKKIESELPDNWKEISYYNTLQNFGSDWYNEKRKLILKTPSVIMPGEYNFVLNTRHPKFEKVEILTSKHFTWDSRLRTLF